MKDKDQCKALFWCSLLQPVLYDQIEEAQVHQFLKELAQEEVLFPNGVRKKPSLSSLQRKLSIFKKDGFEALARKRRSDRGKPRVQAGSNQSRSGRRFPIANRFSSFSKAVTSPAVPGV